MVTETDGLQVEYGITLEKRRDERAGVAVGHFAGADQAEAKGLDKVVDPPLPRPDPVQYMLGPRVACCLQCPELSKT